MLSASAKLRNGHTNSDYGSSISQRLLKAQEDFVPPVKKKYNPVKNMNERLWGYFEEFRDFVHIGDSVNLRSIIKECPQLATYFEDYDNNLHEMMSVYNIIIEHARLGECREIVCIFEARPEFIDVVHTFVNDIDVKKQLLAIQYLAKKERKDKLCAYIRGRATILSTVSARYEAITASANRRERVIQFNELISNIKEGKNAEIRKLRGGKEGDPHLTSDIADIIECDRLFNFETMLTCASEGNTIYMRFLVEKYPYLVNYISDEGESIFFNAVKKQHLEVIKALRNCDYGITDSQGMTALHHSCEGAMKPLTHFFIHNGADVNAQDKMGNTPMHLICRSRKPSMTIIKMLILGEARVDILNKHRMTCLDMLAQNGFDTLRSYVLSSYKKEQSKPPIMIKSAKEKNRDLLCFKHLSYSCPCAATKRNKVNIRQTRDD